MAYDVTDYNAVTGRRTGDLELGCPGLPPAKPGLIRKAVDRETRVIAWVMPDGAVKKVKPAIIRLGG